MYLRIPLRLAVVLSATCLVLAACRGGAARGRAARAAVAPHLRGTRREIGRAHV